eukprot:snap_masked-scaffold_1-processed-gene-2.19-mRNA-1 protein AED:0.44 eAED:0.44 QI:0/-1/0/1/-1/1/1/0/173
MKIKQKRNWTKEEDEHLSLLVKRSQGNSWSQIGALFPSRSAKQCRDRWFNHLRPELNKSPWSAQEDKRLFAAYKRYGNSWSKIAKECFPGRTDLSVKNRFYSFRRKEQRVLKGLVDGSCMPNKEESVILSPDSMEVLFRHKIETLELMVRVKDMECAWLMGSLKFLLSNDCEK